MKIAIVRGKFLNEYEMQSFAPLTAKHELVGFASRRPLSVSLAFPVVSLQSHGFAGFSL